MTTTTDQMVNLRKLSSGLKKRLRHAESRVAEMEAKLGVARDRIQELRDIGAALKHERDYLKTEPESRASAAAKGEG